ncbi:hypothetical protein MES4922_510003 [Mesorhizobium ventifaucium]|uniref:Uncharacterized protein n=1 Tax=Mesorhizobium ventifaucium TaxID=666020 RepID=A0ABN8K8C9_9HYPH|nr:hypothetical protein MES4922_510003 [Mesorhizobium ventifaucium]
MPSPTCPFMPPRGIAWDGSCSHCTFPQANIPGNPQNSTPLHAAALFAPPGGAKVAQGKGKLLKVTLSRLEYQHPSSVI